MSLDVYLYTRGPGAENVRQTERIFIRRGGRTVEVSRDEWDELYPGREPHMAVLAADEDEGALVFEANITHNLGRMAEAAGIYKPLWRPDELGIEQAAQLIQPLQEGLAALRAGRPHFEQFNPPNGWGDYDALLWFTAEYLAACERWPEAEVRVSR